jgi:hypothetical protein
MQHIGIILQNEESELLEDSHINFAPVLDEIYKIDDQKESSSLLWMINPYGDTTFNSIQIPIVISQLKALEFSEDNKEIVNKVIKFLGEAGLNEYICFLGD